MFLFFELLFEGKILCTRVMEDEYGLMENNEGKNTAIW